MLFVDPKLKKYICDSPKYNDFINKIDSVCFTPNELPDTFSQTINEICSNDESLISFLNQHFSQYTKQQQEDFLSEKAVQDIIHNPNFPHERIQETVLLTLLEASSELPNADISTVFQQWVLSYITEHGSFPNTK